MGSDNQIGNQLAVALFLLLIFSAIPATATAAMWVGWFLFILVWWNAWLQGQLTTFGTSLGLKGGQ